MNDGYNESPFHSLPPLVVALTLAIMGIELAFQAGSAGFVGGAQAVGWRQAAVESYGFNGAIWDWMVQNGLYPAEHLMRLVTYQFVHGNLTHAAFASVLLLAMGNMVGQVFHPVATLAVFIVSGIVAAAGFGLILDNRMWLVGAYPGVYGLIGGYTYLLWLRLGELGQRQVQAFTLIGFLMGIQLLFGLLFGGSPDWVADVIGFITGFVMSFFVSPGGFAKLRGKIRHE